MLTGIKERYVKVSSMATHYTSFNAHWLLVLQACRYYALRIRDMRCIM